MNYKSDLIYNDSYKAFILEIKGVFYNLPDSKPIIDFKHLKSKNASRFIINFSNTRLLTSNGIRCLIFLKDLAEKEGFSFHILCNNEAIFNTMMDLSLNGVFSIVKDLKALPV